MIELKIEGGRELERALINLGRKSLAVAQLRNAQKQALEPVAEQARQLAPKDTGELAASIKPRTVSRRRGAERDTVTVGVGPDRARFYGMFHEFGTSTLPARPFIRPAWDQHRGRLVSVMASKLWALIDKAAAREARRTKTR